METCATSTTFCLASFVIYPKLRRKGGGGGGLMKQSVKFRQIIVQRCALS